MNLYRFYTGDIQLEHDFWLHDKQLLQKWNESLRIQQGQQVILFDGIQHDRLYKIDQITGQEAHLLYVTELERKVPKHNIYLLWHLREGDANDQVLQNCTKAGVSHFLPLISEESGEVRFDHNRAEELVIEAAEQGGRSDVPTVREPMHMARAVEQLSEKIALYVCGREGENVVDENDENIGLLIVPEAGWSDAQKGLLAEKQIKHLLVSGLESDPDVTALAALKLLQ